MDTHGVKSSSVKEYEENIIRNIVEKMLESLPQHYYELSRVHKSENGNFYGKNNTREFEIELIAKSTADVKELTKYTGELKNTVENYLLFSNNGNLVLRISTNSFESLTFPLCEIILTNSSGKSILVYLPQIVLNKSNPQVYVYVTTDGSTFFDQNLSNPARLSAGQVHPMCGKYPLRQRIPTYLNLQIGDLPIKFQWGILQ